MRFEDDLCPVKVGGLTFTKVEDLAAYYDSSDFEDRYTYYGSDLGAVLKKEGEKTGTFFSFWSPTAEKVSVKLYATGSDAEEGARVLGQMPMVRTEKGVWRSFTKEILENVYYTYEVTHGTFTCEIGDPYAKACGVNGQRSMVADLDSLCPEGWEEDQYHFQDAATKAVIWEVHIRDFSFDPSGSMENRGKYLAFTETGTTVLKDGAHPTGVDYLKKLGVTHVHLLPAFDYATVDEASLDSEQYNWGYDPLNYNVPEGSYATDPFHGQVRILEFRSMVKALHDANIGVILDVVYNHTYHTKVSWFERAVPYYYHRTRPDGSFANASGCGNETASERSMMRLYMLDSIRLWAEEYHIDGFRFDLMAIHDTDTINEVRNMLDGLPDGKQYLVYGEPWAASSPSLPVKFHSAGMVNSYLLADNIAIFSDYTRDNIKGSAFDANRPGFINGGIGLEEALTGAITAYHTKEQPVSPCKTITYVSAHDNYTLWDKIYLTMQGDGSGYDDPEMRRVAVNKISAAIILTSQGIPFFQAGEEFGRTKYGDGNSYKSPSSVNCLKWERTKTFSELVSYYQGLIQIRKAFSCFTDSTGKAAESIRFSRSEGGILAYTIKGQKKGEPRLMTLIFNASEETKLVRVERDDVVMPKAWNILANEQKAGLTPISTVEGNEFTVYLRGVVVAASKELL